MLYNYGYEDEEWANILGYPDYLVSNYGRVWSIRSDRPLKPFPDKNGYQIVSLFYRGKRVDKKIHRLVASAFISNNSDLDEVNHDDGDKSYNFVENLEWNTHDQNMQHAFRNGFCIMKTVRIVETGEVFKNQRSLAKAINGNEGAISECLSGKRNRHRGFTFEYVD